MRRNLLVSAIAALMVGGMVLAPSIASAQSRDRDSRDHSRSQDRDSVRREDRNRNDRYRSNDRDRNNSSRDWDRSRDRTDNRDWDRDHDGDNDRHGSTWHLWGRLDNQSRDRRDRDRDRDRYRDDYRYRVERYPVYVYPRTTYRQPDYYYGGGYSYRDSNDWRSIADAAGLLAVIGLLDHDDTLTFVGGVGALYSLSRYDDDRYSRDRACRLRAEYFSHPYFVRDGRRYDRESVTYHGDRYYRFVCR